MTPVAMLALACCRDSQDDRGSEPLSRHGLIARNLPFVFRVAGEYRGQGVAYEDLLMEGVLGLLQAADHYDPSRGVHFITYAVWWIRRAMVNAIAGSARQVRLPRYRSQQFRTARRRWSELAGRLGHPPTGEDLASSLGTSVTEAMRRLQSYPAEIPLEQHPGDGRGRSRLDQIPDPVSSPEASLIDQDTMRSLRSALGSLSPRERAVLTSRFGLDGNPRKTLRQLGSALGLTKERVRQIEASAVARLRAILRSGTTGPILPLAEAR